MMCEYICLSWLYIAKEYKDDLQSKTKKWNKYVINGRRGHK
jgi:hypothetical protein